MSSWRIFNADRSEKSVDFTFTKGGSRDIRTCQKTFDDVDCMPYLVSLSVAAAMWSVR